MCEKPSSVVLPRSVKDNLGEKDLERVSAARAVDNVVDRQTNERLSMASETIYTDFNDEIHLNRERAVLAPELRRYAVFTVPQNEKSAVRHLDLRKIKSCFTLLETAGSTCHWKIPRLSSSVQAFSAGMSSSFENLWLAKEGESKPG